MFKAALNWACQKYDGGHPLLTRHALEKGRIPAEKDPKRPVLDAESIRALLAVAPTAHPLLRPMILLAWRTGRRLSAILALRWDDLDFEEGTIRWRAEHDKIRQTWVVPARRYLLKELRRFRAERPGIGSVLLFPHPQHRRHRGGPVTRHLAAYWLKEAFERGRIAKAKGGLWHMFRRAWATERRDLPLKDVAAAGGWRDTSTLLRYQQPDEERCARWWSSIARVGGRGSNLGVSPTANRRVDSGDSGRENAPPSAQHSDVGLCVAPFWNRTRTLRGFRSCKSPLRLDLCHCRRLAR